MSESSAADTTYDRFAHDPAYVAANRAFIAGLPLARARRLLDLACGTGAVGELMLAAAPGASLVGIDLDPLQIGLAAENYTRLGYAVRLISANASALPAEPGRLVSLAVGSATELPFPEASFDFAMIANAIHLIEDKVSLVTGVARVLQPGGIFAFNSGFYAGCWPLVTQQVYYDWMKEATAWIVRHSAERVAAGEPPVRRVRGKSQPTATSHQNRWLTPGEWRELLASHDFEVRALNERAVMFNQHSLAAIGAYSGMAEAQLSGYPVQIAARALEETAAVALANANVDEVQHNWIEICAARRAA